MRVKNLVIGGGSAGLHFASLQKSTVIEEHEKIGLPIACTGLVTNELFKFYDEKEIKKITVKKINTTRVEAGNTAITLDIDSDHVLCNQSLIELINKKAIENNSNILTKHHFIGNSHNKAKILNRNTGKEFIIQFDKLIGADGPHSKVAKLNSLAQNKEFVVGVQVIRNHKMEDSIHFYPQISEYAWAVPEGNNKIRLGLCTRSKTAKPEFDKFQNKYPGIDSANISGVIPLFKPRLKIQKNNIHLIGDAAAHTKNTTGGGIIAGIKAAESLNKSYKKINLNKELYLHYLANNILKKYNDKEWDKLLNLVNTKTVKQIIKLENRDNFTKMAIKLLTKKPSVALGILPLIR